MIFFWERLEFVMGNKPNKKWVQAKMTNRLNNFVT